MGVGIVVQIRLCARCQVVEEVEHRNVQTKLVVHQRGVVVQIDAEVLVNRLQIGDGAFVIVLTPVPSGHRETVGAPGQAGEHVALEFGDRRDLVPVVVQVAGKVTPGHQEQAAVRGEVIHVVLQGVSALGTQRQLAEARIPVILTEPVDSGRGDIPTVGIHPRDPSQLIGRNGPVIRRICLEADFSPQLITGPRGHRRIGAAVSGVGPDNAVKVFNL